MWECVRAHFIAIAFTVYPRHDSQKCFNGSGPLGAERSKEGREIEGGSESVRRFEGFLPHQL